MFDKLKQAIGEILQGGTNLVKNAVTRNLPNFTTNPQRQATLSQGFQDYVLKSPLKYRDSVNTIKNDFTPGIDKIRFTPPYQEEMRQVPTNATSVSVPEWLKKIGNTAADLTYRGIITRPAAQATMSIADALTPGQFPSVQATDPAGKLLFGNQPMTSYQQSTKNAQGWLEKDLGINHGNAMKLGLAAGIANAGLDLPFGLGVKNLGKESVEKLAVHNADDAVEMLWKSKSAKDKLKAMLGYGDSLIKSGYSREEIDKIPAKLGTWLAENGITPAAFKKQMESSTTSKQALGNFYDTFKDWVGKRQGAKWQGLLKSQDFKYLDSVPLDELAPVIESGKHNEALAGLRAYFDDALVRLNEAGIKTSKVENYLPHIYNQSKEQVEMALGRKLSRGSQFSLSRVFKDYAEAKGLGFTSKFGKLSDLIADYESKITKSIQDKKMFDYLKDNKLILTKTDISKLGKEARASFKDWLPIDNKVFGSEFKTDTSYLASKDVRQAIEGYLQDFGNPNVRVDKLGQFLKSAGGWNARIKALILTGGVPKTALNSYGYIIHKRFTLASQTPIADAVRGYKWMLSPNSADRFIQRSLKDAATAVESGLTLDATNFDVTPYIQQSVKGFVGQNWEKMKGVVSDAFETPLFKKTLPAMKLYAWKNDVQILLKEGIDLKTAQRTAAETVNEQLSGANLDMLMKNDKGLEAFFRTVALAPSYYRSSIDVAKGVANTLLQPNSIKSKLYKTYARNMVAYRLLQEVTNKMLSGQWMYQNDTGHKNEVATSMFDSDGSRIYLKNSGQDYSNLPINVIDGLANGDMGVVGRQLVNKSSPLTQLGVAGLFGVDYRGRKIVNSYDTPAEKIASVANFGSKYVLPPQVSEAGLVAMGKQTPVQGLSRILEAPFNFVGGASTDKEKQQAEYMRQGGATNQQINEKIEGSKWYNQPKDLTDKQRIKNLQEGLPIDTQRNWLGQPKLDGSKPGANALEGSNNTEMTSTTSLLQKGLQGQKDQAKKKEIAKEIFSSLNDEASINKALEANGLTLREATNMLALDLGVESGARGEFVIAQLKERGKASEDDFMNTFTELVQDDVLTTGVTSALVKSGDITPERKKQFDAWINAINGKKPSSGTSSSQKIKLNLPTLRAPKAHLSFPEMKVSETALKPFTVNQIKESGAMPKLQQGSYQNPKDIKVKFSSLPSR